MLLVNSVAVLLCAAVALLSTTARAADDDDFDPRAAAPSESMIINQEDEEEEDVKRVTFLDKARECEAKCDGKRASLPECDLFCIDEPCFVRIFGNINLMGGGQPTRNLDDPKKIEAFTRCAKLRLLPAIPAALRSKKALKDEQRRQMSDWRARMEQRRIALAAERSSLFQSQKAERAKMEDDKAEKRRRAAEDAAKETKDEL